MPLGVRRRALRWTPDMHRRAWALNAEGKPLATVFTAMKSEFPGISKSAISRNLTGKLAQFKTREELELAIFGKQLDRKKPTARKAEVKSRKTILKRIFEETRAINYHSESLISAVQDRKRVKEVMEAHLSGKTKIIFDDFFGITRHRISIADLASHHNITNRQALEEINRGVEILSHHINLIVLVK